MVCGDAGPLGADAARLDDDDVDVEGGELHAQRVGERLDGVLRGVVPAAERGGEAPAHGGDVDDGAAAALAHARGDEAGEGGEAEDVDVELAAGLLERHVLDGAVGAVAGVVDEDVDAAGLGQDRLDGGADGVLIGEVEGERAQTVLREGGEAVGAPGGAVQDGVPAGEALVALLRDVAASAAQDRVAEEAARGLGVASEAGESERAASAGSSSSAADSSSGAEPGMVLSADQRA